MKIDASIFKAYDIRGVVDHTLTEDAVRAVGRVLGSLALDRGAGRFCVGRDGRLTGERLQNALVEGIASTGMDVLDVGAVPTPVLYYATKYFDCGTGVAVTGSHNPPEYNGLKMMVAGVTLFADQIQNVRERIEREVWLTAVSPGSIERVDAVTPYVEKVIDGVRLSRRLKVVVD
ncbi:phosphomannomutase/phosphoglucomutase, partial [Sutterella seckii]